jgi:hypothetical protein
MFRTGFLFHEVQEAGRYITIINIKVKELSKLLETYFHWSILGMSIEKFKLLGKVLPL